MLKYSQYDYKRIDVEKFKRDANEVLDSFNLLPSATDQIGHIKKLENIMGEWATYNAIASLEYSRNTFSKENKEENEFYDNIDPEMQEISTKYANAMLASPFRGELEKEFGNHIFNLKELERKTFKPEIKDMLREESDLCNRYTELIASAKIDFKSDICL